MQMNRNHFPQLIPNCVQQLGTVKIWKSGHDNNNKQRSFIKLVHYTLYTRKNERLVCAQRLKWVLLVVVVEQRVLLHSSVVRLNIA